MNGTGTRLQMAIASGAAVLLALLAPNGLGELGGSGSVSDAVALTTVTGAVNGPDLASATGEPAASATPFAVTNANSNVDTLIRYSWGTTPYHGASPAGTSLSVRGVTYSISDLLWFRQSVIEGTGATASSEYYSPLLLKSAATITRVTWTPSGNACTGWIGTPAPGFSSAAAGTFTFMFHSSSSPVDNAPATSDTFHYCLDTTNSRVYLGKAAVFATATLVHAYTENSVQSVVRTYQYEFLSGLQVAGNRYCLAGFTGSGTGATPDLAQCQRMTFSLVGPVTSRLYPLFDPPDAFPSGNQLGVADAITYGVAGTQWNPFAHTTTNAA